MVTIASGVNIGSGIFVDLATTVAVGGNISTYTQGNVNYKLHTFTTNGNFTVYNPGDPGQVEVFAVGGGGASGSSGGGGGGGGQVLQTNVVVGSQQYTVTVGTGGQFTTGGLSVAQNGNPSSFVGGNVNVTAIGGGAGGWASDPPSGAFAQDGGSGGGGRSVGNSAGGVSTVGQGNGAPSTDITGVSSGGGGAGGAGEIGTYVAPTLRGGNGGPGLSSTFSGTAVFYAAGGGGSSGSGNAALSFGLGGSGVGGNGAVGASPQVRQNSSGTPNSGSGAGGGLNSGGGDVISPGADGVVMIRYQI